MYVIFSGWSVTSRVIHPPPPNQRKDMPGKITLWTDTGGDQNFQRDLGAIGPFEIRMDQWALCLVFREIHMDQWRWKFVKSQQCPKYQLHFPPKRWKWGPQSWLAKEGSQFSISLLRFRRNFSISSSATSDLDLQSLSHRFNCTYAWLEQNGKWKKQESGPNKTMTATDVTGFDAIFSTGFFATFSRFWGPETRLTKLHINTGRRSKKSSGEPPVETAPRNCRFLSLVVAKLVLKEWQLEFETLKGRFSWVASDMKQANRQIEDGIASLYQVLRDVHPFLDILKPPTPDFPDNPYPLNQGGGIHPLN